MKKRVVSFLTALLLCGLLSGCGSPRSEVWTPVRGRETAESISQEIPAATEPTEASLLPTTELQTETVPTTAAAPTEPDEPATLPPSSTEETIPATETEASSDRNLTPATEPSEGDAQVSYVANTNTKKFHLPSCSSVTDMKESNKLYFTGTREELIDQGYEPCKRCKP